VLADLLDMPGHSVLVVAPDVGGGFGGKASLYQEEILVAVLARHLGRPVRWTGSRLEDLTATSHGFDEIVEAELALDLDGRICALKAEVIGDVGAYSIYPWTAALEPVQSSASSRAPTGSRHIAGRRAPLRRTRRLPGLIAASAARFRPLSWSG